MAKAQTLEQSFEKLEEIIEKLEDGSIGLDESFKLYKDGIKILSNCNQQLDKVEKQIIVLDDSEALK